MTNQEVIKIKTCIIIFVKYYYFDICFKTLINICDYISFLVGQRRSFKKSWCECTPRTLQLMPLLANFLWSTLEILFLTKLDRYLFAYI